MTRYQISQIRVMKSATHPQSCRSAPSVRKTIAGLLLIVLVISGLAGCGGEDRYFDHPPLKIGVLLPYSGDYAMAWDHALDWAVGNINSCGGVSGSRLELVKKDSHTEDLPSLAREMAEDPSLLAVIGPLTSSEVYQTAPAFINQQKVFIAPVATAADLSKAFSRYDYFWRLTESDITQIKTLLLLARSGGARSVSLITEESPYGASFEDWFGFFATELDLEVSSVVVIPPDDPEQATAAWNQTIARHPDAVISSLNQPALNISLVRAYRANGQQCRLLMSDAGVFQSLISELGDLAENLEGITVSSDPSSGFDISYKVRYGQFPSAFLAHIYDAVVLLALALQESEGQGGAVLAEAMKTVVAARGEPAGWRRDDLAVALKQIGAGVYPDISGASGPLDFDEWNFSDVTTTTYGHWRVDAAQFVVTEFFTSDGEGRISSTSAAYRIIASHKQQFSSEGHWRELPPREQLQAFLMAGSRGWANYRHQADVLHTYQLLKSYGVPDQNIILILEDDLAHHPSNNLTGQLFNEPGGANLYHDVQLDYQLSSLKESHIRSIFMGESTPETPHVIRSDSLTNVFVFTSSHGTPDGMVVELADARMLTPDFWSTLFDSMHTQGRYRLLLGAMEACYSGAIGQEVSTPGVVLLTAANPYETSKSHFYEPALKSWLADQFAWSVNYAIARHPDIPLETLYEQAHSKVNGSHVSLYNHVNFGNIFEIRLSEFIQP